MDFGITGMKIIDRHRRDGRSDIDRGTSASALPEHSRSGCADGGKQGLN